ncbi:hypothetical protein BRAS3843_570006 [Bradyrhizobium sp. STM 3843]|nr:hypothetical protein BRAS3843_570006 [Bradyrhizobium sp. STM 3843]
MRLAGSNATCLQSQRERTSLGRVPCSRDVTPDQIKRFEPILAFPHRIATTRDYEGEYWA